MYKRQDNVESKGMRVNMNKTEVVISEKRQKVRQKAVRWPCGVCSKGVGSNSVQCSSCQKWVHKQCSGIKGSMSKGAKSFICSGCLNPVTTPRVKKKRHQTLSHNFTDYYPIFKIFSLSDSSKFATNSCLNIRPHFKHVATLPCEI